MPVVLSIDEVSQYLENDNLDLLNQNFVSSIENEFSVYSVGNFVNNPKNNSIECIKHIK